ncbi:MAG: hypothetical protein MR288_00095 [Firmicutes bacterium]|nr:hypothetical protein [Bacillota bacterium]
MQMFLMNLAQSIMGFTTKTALFTEGGAGEATTPSGESGVSTVYDKVFAPIIKILDAMLWPVLILVGTAGSIYAIVLGVNFSKAESADKREEAKKRMINAIIGLVVTIILLILLKLFTANAETIANWINGYGKTDK